MRALFLIATLACFEFGCTHGNPLFVRGKLDDAVKRHASIDERIVEWGHSERERDIDRRPNGLHMETPLV